MWKFYYAFIWGYSNFVTFTWDSVSYHLSKSPNLITLVLHPHNLEASLSVSWKFQIKLLFNDEIMSDGIIRFQSLYSYFNWLGLCHSFLIGWLYHTLIPYTPNNPYPLLASFNLFFNANYTNQLKPFWYSPEHFY